MNVASDFWEHRPERLVLCNSYHEVAQVFGWDQALDIGMKVWLAKRSLAKRSDLAAGGWGDLYVPGCWVEGKPRAIALLLGNEVAKKMILHFPNRTMSFPSIRAICRVRMRAAMIEQLRKGNLHRNIAFSYNVAERTVGRLAAELRRAQDSGGQADVPVIQ